MRTYAYIITTLLFCAIDILPFAAGLVYRFKDFSASSTITEDEELSKLCPLQPEDGAHQVADCNTVQNNQPAAGDKTCPHSMVERRKQKNREAAERCRHRKIEK